MAACRRPRAAACWRVRRARAALRQLPTAAADSRCRQLRLAHRRGVLGAARGPGRPSPACCRAPLLLAAGGGFWAWLVSFWRSCFGLDDDPVPDGPPVEKRDFQEWLREELAKDPLRESDLVQGEFAIYSQIYSEITSDREPLLAAARAGAGPRSAGAAPTPHGARAPQPAGQHAPRLPPRAAQLARHAWHSDGHWCHASRRVGHALTDPAPSCCGAASLRHSIETSIWDRVSYDSEIQVGRTSCGRLHERMLG